MLHLLGTSLLFYLTQRSGHAPRLGLPNRYSIHAVKNLSSKKKNAHTFFFICTVAASSCEKNK